MNEIGNYRILKKLGEGGMGEVFMGEDMMLERKVAIKILRPELSQREDVLQRFRSEAVALGRLNHPNIATVYAFAKDGNHYYLAMEFVNGEPLDTVISKRGKLAWHDAVRYVCGALAGLEHAHRLNVIHRDIKPANIMLAYSGEIKLMDFGIARILERARQTRSGYMLGTLEYISPEQAQGLDVDARSDIYSMGAVLYEMLTGRLPFQKNTDYELLQAQIKELPQSPRTFAGDMPQALENIILKALEKDPVNRFSTALEFSQALSSILGGSSFDNVNTPLTRMSKPLPDFNRPEQNYQPSKATAQRKSQFVALVKNYPIPVVSAILLAMAIPYFAMNTRINLPETPIQKVDTEHTDDIKPIADKNSTSAKTPVENQPVNSPSFNSQAMVQPQLREYPDTPPSPEINKIKEDNSQKQNEIETSVQKSSNVVVNKAKQKTVQGAQKNSGKENKRREVLAKSKKEHKRQETLAKTKKEPGKEQKRREVVLAKIKKEHGKNLVQHSGNETPKKESSGWVIIPGQTRKTY